MRFQHAKHALQGGVLLARNVLHLLMQPALRDLNSNPVGNFVVIWSNGNRFVVLYCVVMMK